MKAEDDEDDVDEALVVEGVTTFLDFEKYCFTDGDPLPNRRDPGMYCSVISSIAALSTLLPLNRRQLEMSSSVYLVLPLKVSRSCSSWDKKDMPLGV